MTDAEGTLTAAHHDMLLEAEQTAAYLNSRAQHSETFGNLPMMGSGELRQMATLIARLGLAAQQGANPLHAAAREYREAVAEKRAAPHDPSQVIGVGTYWPPDVDKARAAARRLDAATKALHAAALAAAERATDSTS